uniref:Integrase catalytic domain-containing protein n=1 Tax=Haemonchus contortus TaxID=6289 RepID=A0A7I4Y7G5_HAECO|nr:Integrase domain containing protein [Haemonchus contortus]
MEGPHALVTYTDASAIAMAACTYLSAENVSHLVMAKSKVSDVQKETTTPKLELNALTIGARLSQNVLRSLIPVMHVSHILLLSDSEIALKWISSPIHRNNGVFVRNRVREIRKIVDEITTLGVPVRFGYIDTANNPADCGTRGMSSKEFSTHKWWTGYSLKEINEDHIMRNIVTIPEDDGEEMMESVDVHAIQASDDSEITDIIELQRFGSLTKARRVLAYALRFLKKVCSRVDGELQSKLQDHLPWLRHDTKESSLSARDIHDANHALLRNHQMAYVKTPYRKELSKNLNLKEDNTKLLRTYGRLNKSDLDPMANNPIFIVPHTELSQMIISEAHGKYHRSTAHTMSEVRQKYWIPRLREQVKKCIHQCVPCQKANNLPFKYPEMTDIPGFRVTKARPFQHIGLDYFGPLTVSQEDMVKLSVYGCIFTCAVTRMLHLELVTDGTTEKFINAFRRFVARRGKPDTVTCDNAPTFLLGNQILKESTQTKEVDEEVERLMSNEGIEWHHITPYSPWKGGFYERLIQSVKSSMYKAIGRRILTMKQLATLLTEVEACLNTRPLTYQETDYDDNILSLRPIDFIQNGMCITIPFDFSNEDQTDPAYIPPSEVHLLNTRLQVVNALRSSCALREHFWKVWKNSYLTALREQHRRNMDNKRGSSSQPYEGEVVLIMDPCQKRTFWKLGRIEKFIRSSDGAIREVEVSSGRNSLRRPVNQLVPLEINNPQNHIHSNNQARADNPREQRQDEEEKTVQKVPRYNLRPRVTHQSTISTEEGTINLPKTRHRTYASSGSSATCLQISMTVVMAAVMVGRQTPSSTIDSPKQHLIECRPEGVYLHSPTSSAYELCVSDYCVAEHAPPIQKVIHVPTRYLLHEFEVQWKVREKGNFSVIENQMYILLRKRPQSRVLADSCDYKRRSIHLPLDRIVLHRLLRASNIRTSTPLTLE